MVPAIPEDMTNYREVENIYEDLADMPLGSAQNYPDIKTTVLWSVIEKTLANQHSVVTRGIF